MTTKLERFERERRRLFDRDDSVRDDAIAAMGDLLPDDSVAEKIILAACESYPADRSVNADLIELFWDEENCSPIVVELIETHFEGLAVDEKGQEYALRALTEMRTSESMRAFGALLASLKDSSIDLSTALVVIDEPVQADHHMFPQYFEALATSEHWFELWETLLDQVEAKVIDLNEYPEFVEYCVRRTQAILDEHGQSIGQYDGLTDDELSALADTTKELEMLLDVARWFGDDSVERLLHRATKLDSPRLRLFAIVSLIACGTDGFTNELSDIAENQSNRWILWEMLEKIERLNVFPAKFNTQESLAEAEMVMWIEHPFELNRPPDDIHLLSKLTTILDDETHDWFLFRFRSQGFEENQWLVGWAGPYETDQPPCIGGRKTFSHFHTLESLAIVDHISEFISHSCGFQLPGESNFKSWLDRLPDRDPEELAKITRLELYGEPVTDRHCATLEACKSLTKLELDGEEITDESAKSIAKLRSLTRLDVSDTKITDAGAKLFGDLTKLGSLEVPADVSDETIASLREQLTDAEIMRGSESLQKVFEIAGKAGLLERFFREERKATGYLAVLAVVSVVVLIGQWFTFSEPTSAWSTLVDGGWAMLTYLALVTFRRKTPLIPAACAVVVIVWAAEFGLMMKGDLPAAISWLFDDSFCAQDLGAHLIGISLAMKLDRDTLPKTIEVNVP